MVGTPAAGRGVARGEENGLVTGHSEAVTWEPTEGAGDSGWELSVTIFKENREKRENMGHLRS